MTIEDILSAQRAFFRTGATLPVEGRLAALRRLKSAILRHGDDINAALKADLNKSPFESYMCEVGMVLSELSFIQKHLRRWARDRRVPTPLAHFPAASFLHPEPYGVTLVMAPWNYPFLLTMEPLIGALAAGNCVVVKPSNYAPAASALIARLLGEVFDPAHVAVVQGGRAENQALLDQKFDYIFFTGSPAVGREVMARAARHLTPVSLELGGKSPCIVDASAHLPLAARRIAFGKFLNAGQTCVAPDYLLVHESVKERLADQLEKAVTAFFGADPLSCDDYVKIINHKHYRRLLGLLEGERARFGGQARDGRIAPTLLDAVTPNSPVMQEEIFGPLLPMLTYRELDEAVAFVSERPKPLALYLFTRDKEVERQVLSRLSYGGGCVNDTVVHLATSRLPFGGVGESGMGSYHGKASFDTFTHDKGILKKSNRMDLPMRYRPYSEGKGRLVKLFLK